ncbi:MAG: hypothetical protein PQJ60_13550, partial [Spirochaetales bacterium]|nr:hypothetical protein [Spirochaetales bacterium]
MIEELLSYFEEGFYQEKDEKIVQALAEYEQGRNLPGEEGVALREQARRELESQLVASGQAEEETVFINPEEFFPEGQRDQDKIDTFRRDMTRSHAGQQMLWSFAGTTGAMTVITEKHLESLGRDLDRLKPAALRRKEKAKKEKKKSPGTVSLYLYGDGSCSEVYDKQKAKLDFNRCRDKSGFDWNQAKYDPNYSVEKKGWFGGLNKEGIWEAVDTQPAGTSRPSVNSQTAPKREIELVSTLNGALIFDAALLLCGPEEEEYYYSLDGELYGAVKTDRSATVNRLKESLKGQSPAGIVLPAGVEEETRKAYEELLSELSDESENSPQIYLETEESWQTLLEEDREQREELEEATRSLGATARLRQSGVEEEAIDAFLSSESPEIEVPLNPFVKEDRSVLLGDSLNGLDQEKRETVQSDVDNWFDKKDVNPEDMAHVLPAVTAALPLLAVALENGLGSESVLEEAYNSGVKSGKGGASKVKLNGRVTLEELSRGVTPWGSSSSSKKAKPSPDFFNGESLKTAATQAGLKEGEILSLGDAVNRLNLPPMDRKEFNKRLASALNHYRTVQTSTGMTVSDLVSTVDSLTMKRPDAKRWGGKEVYFEENLGDLLEAGRAEEIPTKKVSRDELFQPLLSSVPSFAQLDETIEEETSAGELFSDSDMSQSYTATPVSPILDNSTALNLTTEVLSALAAGGSEESQSLSTRQLGGLQKLYESAGAPSDVARKAVQQWESVQLSPQEYKSLRADLKNRLKQEETRIARAVEAQQRAVQQQARKAPSALGMTEKLLKPLAAVSSPGAVNLDANQLSQLEKLYRQAGGEGANVKKALDLWKDVKVTPEEYEVVRDQLLGAVKGERGT